ncbi:WD40-repeat-containing domain protein [Entophlyctis helioformis]|nr:WD40-repeat-containing domain protein [Entophlyctis helioformis]
MPAARKSKQPKPSPQVLQVAPFAVSAFALSPSSGAVTHVAAVTPALDAARLVVYGTADASHAADYTTPAGSLCSSVAFGKHKEQILVALPLSTGSILVYSVSAGTLLLTLANGHRGPVVDFCFSPVSRKGFSIGDDGLLVEWDLKKGTAQRSFQSKSKNLSKIAIDAKGKTLAVAANQIDILDIESWAVVKTLTGHATQVSQLLFDPSSPALFSAAIDDRFISQWPLEASGAGLPTVYTVDSPANFLSLSPAGVLLAQLQSGEVHLWNTGAAAEPAKPESASKKKKGGAAAASAARASESRIVINHATAVGETVPIHNAAFDGDRVVVVYGTSFRPFFERIAYLDEAGKLIPSISVSRNPDAPTRSDTAAAGASTPRGPVHVLGAIDMLVPTYGKGASSSKDAVLPLDFDDETTLEDRVKALDPVSTPGPRNRAAFAAVAATPTPATPATPATAAAAAAATPATPATGNRKAATPLSLAQMLSQAIHSGDVQMLEKSIETGDKKVIAATVARLSPTQVVSLLELLVVRLQRRPTRAPQLIEWVRSLLMTHSAYLLSVPTLATRLGSLYRTLDTRQQTLTKLNRLYGRLDLAVSQMDAARSTLLMSGAGDDADVVVYDDEDEDGDASDDESEMISDDEMVLSDDDGEMESGEESEGEGEDDDEDEGEDGDEGEKEEEGSEATVSESDDDQDDE